MKKIAYYVTAHGYGHAVRSSDIIHGLFRAMPDLDLTLVTNVPDAFWENRLVGRAWRRVPGSFDVGMVQLDSVRVDIPATRERVRSILAERPRLIAEQSAWLREGGFDLVVCDVPAIPIEAAKRAGLPAVAVANFTWSWIYGEFGWEEEIAAFIEGYAKADLCIACPFSGPLDEFPRKKEVGILAAPGVARRTAFADAMGADPDKPWVLLSFSTLDWAEAALENVRALDQYEFFTIEPLGWRGANLHQVDRRQFQIPDVFATVDIVLTKPGFGATSECIVNEKPMVWVDRTGFRETPVLVREIKRLLRNVEIPEADLYAGRIGPSLAAVANAPEPTSAIAVDGSDRAAAAILGLCG